MALSVRLRSTGPSSKESIRPTSELFHPALRLLVGSERDESRETHTELPDLFTAAASNTRQGSATGNEGVNSNIYVS